MRRAVWILALALVPLTGCTVLTPSYWGKHISKVSDDFHNMRVDIDEVVFGFESGPVESDHR